MRAPMRPDCDELLDAGIADADQGEFGGREERVGCHQEKDQKAPGAAQRRSLRIGSVANSSIPKGLASRATA